MLLALRSDLHWSGESALPKLPRVCKDFDLLFRTDAKDMAVLEDKASRVAGTHGRGREVVRVHWTCTGC